MIGLGATADPSQFITDRDFAGAYTLGSTVTATIGGEVVPVLFAGLTSPGLYLVRIKIPEDLSPGAKTLQVSAGDSKTRDSLTLLLGPAR